jgi:quinol monooxygenase YgiN
MTSLPRRWLWLIVLLFGLVPAAQAQTKLRNGAILSDKPYYIVTYIEVVAKSTAQAAGLIKAQSAAGEKQRGNLRFEALQRIGRPNHFVILEAWADKDARNNHAKAAHTTAFRKALQPHLYNPYDERPHAGLDAVDPAKLRKATAATLFVVTHVDIIPPEQFAPCKRQVSESGPCGNDLVLATVKASRKHPGNLRFDALTQTNRTNHMTIVEMWSKASDQEAHEATGDIKNFRDSLFGIPPGSGVPADPLFLFNPLTGSLYDERFYRPID